MAIILCRPQPQNQCDIYKGYIEYDISFIHPDFGVAIQEYSIETQTSEGENISNNNFALFKKNEVIPTDLSTYPKHCKTMLWEVIFQMKWHYFSKYKPTIVQHFIKHPHDIDKRFELYKNTLMLQATKFIRINIQFGIGRTKILYSHPPHQVVFFMSYF